MVRCWGRIRRPFGADSSIGTTRTTRSPGGLFHFVLSGHGGQTVLQFCDAFVPDSADDHDMVFVLLGYGEIADQVHLVVNDKIGEAAAADFSQDGLIRGGHPDGSIYDQEGDISAAQDETGFFDAFFPKQAVIIETGGICDQDGPQRQDLHRFGNGIRRRAFVIRDNGQILTGQGVDE